MRLNFKNIFILTLHLNLNIRYPFDWKNPIGYLMALFYEFLIEFLLIYGAMALLNFSIGVYLLLISLSEDIKCDLCSFNESARQSDDSNTVTQFSKLIHYHSKVIQLSDFDDYNELWRRKEHNWNFFISIVWQMIYRKWVNSFIPWFFHGVWSQYVAQCFLCKSK